MYEDEKIRAAAMESRANGGGEGDLLRSLYKRRNPDYDVVRGQRGERVNGYFFRANGPNDTIGSQVRIQTGLLRSQHDRGMGMNTNRLKRVVKSNPAAPVAIGAGIGAVVGLVTGSLLVCLAIGTVAGLVLRMKQRG